jgi:hypothetical protein
MSQEERPISWEVAESVILSKILKCTCALFRTVSKIQIFHCTVPKLMIRKRYYVLFLIPIFTVQVKKLVPFTQYNIFSKIPRPTSIHFATRVRTWRVARLYSVQRTVQWNSSFMETIRNRTHVHMQFYLEWPILWPPRILTFFLGYPLYLDNMMAY